MALSEIQLARLKDRALVAEVCLRLDAAREYGLVTGGPDVNIEACHNAIREAEEAGVTYSDDDITVAIKRELTRGNDA